MRVLAGNIVVVLTRPHTLAFVMAAALFCVAEPIMFAPYQRIPHAWLNRLSGMNYAMEWLETHMYPVLESILVIGVFGWWAERRLSGRRGGGAGRFLVEKPVTFAYVAALATAYAALWVMPWQAPKSVWKLRGWFESVPNEWIYLPPWIVSHLLIPIDSPITDIFLIGALGWMVEKRIGSLGMAMTWFPITAVILAGYIALETAGKGLSMIYFPLMGATALLVPWIRVPVPLTRRFLPFPLFALFVLVVVVDAWSLGNAIGFFLQRHSDSSVVGSMVFTLAVHTVGALSGLGVAAYFRAKLRPRPDLVGQQGGRREAGSSEGKVAEFLGKVRRGGA